ncbi:MAG: nuclear transport factor 2 family protein [Pseudomonadota bacterium]
MSTPNLAALVAWYQTLSPASLARLPEFYTEEAYFKDPFQEFSSRARLRRVYEHMFETLQEPRFEVTGTVQEGTQAFLIWNMHCRSGGRALTLHGSTHLTFAADGRVSRHRDYWDAAEELYEKLPVLGWLLRKLKKKLQVPAGPGTAEG